MDPNQAWRDLSDAWDSGEFADCIEIASNLEDWLNKGGFPPTITRHQAFDRAVVLAMCAAVGNRTAKLEA